MIKFNTANHVDRSEWTSVCDEHDCVPGSEFYEKHERNRKMHELADLLDAAMDGLGALAFASNPDMLTGQFVTEHAVFTITKIRTIALQNRPPLNPVPTTPVIGKAP